MVRFVKVEYTGKEKETGKVFDTTKKNVAEKEGLNIKKRFFGAAPLILEDNRLIKGFEKALSGMKPGEEKTVIIPLEEAYGPRNSQLVKLVSSNVFKKIGQKPYPGMVVVFENGMPAKVQSVSGGRVRLDFNHELAGKTLEFELKFVEEVTKKEDKIRFLFESNFPGMDISKLILSFDKESLTLTLPKELLKLNDMQQRKLHLIEDIKKYLEIKVIKFSEEY
jgi:FKBP-type peptidyl-prolyl cis-trans isomerase SlyD